MTAEQGSRWLTIGAFGRQTQLSRKALRLYDERGLLSPAHVDPESGYRYYTPAQFALAHRIRLLRTMDMPLELLAEVLATWETDTQAALALVYQHITTVEQRLATAHTAAHLLRQELIPFKERTMSFTFTHETFEKQLMVSMRRHITIPAYHEWIMPTLRQLWDHIAAAGAQATGDPLALYYGPVNEKDDGPVEIGVPFVGSVPPQGEMKIREWPAHRAVCVRTFGEYNEYPKLLEMWHALGQYVEGQGLTSNWENDLTTYEIWHEDRSMTIGWPVYSFPEEDSQTAPT